jgi:hypothetical protein
LREPREPRRGAPLSEEERPSPHERRALSQVGGETQVAGDPTLCDLLVHALDVAGLDKDRLTHGFHSYPARMHWATPARLLSELKLGGARVLDPFSGSGTVPIEASLAGCTAFGVDLSPFAVRLAQVKADPLTLDQRQELPLVASALRAESEELVRARSKIRAELPPAEIGWYEPHVLKEMAGLFSRIEALEDEPVREVMRFVFSSLVIKFSRQRSDTAEELVTRHVRKGLVSEFFERKAFELAERLHALSEALPGPSAQFAEGDARDLPRLFAEPVDCIITSPPYGGTYDYVEHHARRLAWLGIESTQLRRGELGARRHGDDAQRFRGELREVLVSLRRVLVDDGWLFLWMGDGQHAGARVPADVLIGELAEDTGFAPVALASQPRLDFRGGGPREEHLMALRAC